MFEIKYSTVKEKEEKIESFFETLNYEDITKKQIQDFLQVQSKIEKFTPEFIHIMISIIKITNSSNNYPEPYKIYYERALQDLFNTMQKTFKDSKKIFDNIVISNLEKKRPPYLILLFKRLFNKLWKMKF